MAKKSELGIIGLLVFLAAGCTPQPPPYKAALASDGEILLYLQPLPQEAHRIDFSITEISAVRHDGGVVPLQQFLTDLKADELLTVQKRLASAPLPPGLYEGISLRIGTASLEGEQGTAELLVPDEPLFIEKEFTVSRRRASTLFLSLAPAKLLGGGFRFTPLFSLAEPRRQLESLLGFATSSESNVVSVFDKVTMEVVDTIATGSGPKGAVLDQARGWVYVAVAADAAIEAIEVDTRETLRRARLHSGDEPVEIALSPDGETLVSANYGSSTVSVVETRSLQEVGRVRLPAQPTSVVMGESGRRAYVLHALSNAISVIDLKRLEITATRSFEESPVRGAINEDGDRLYVITRNSPNLLVIDPASLTLIERILVGTGAASIKIDYKTGLIYVGKRDGDIDVIDPSSLMSIDAFVTRSNVVFLSIDDEENALFVVLPGRRQVRKLNLTSKRLEGTVEIADGGYAVVLMGER